MSATDTRAGRRHLRPLTIAFGLVVVFVIVEVVAGFLTGSLSLLSDAGHMATDALGLGMALAAIVAADRLRGETRTFGMYRLEILAALANAVLLFAVAGYVLWEAFGRLQEPPDILTTHMLIVGLAGLAVNVVSLHLLREGATESLNVRGAYLEVVADLAGSVGVVVAALTTMLTGWPYADPIIAALIGLYILPRAWRLGGQAIRVLVQAAPKGLDLAEISRELGSLPGVEDVHDLHVWTLSSDMEVASVHLMIGDDVEPHPVLDRARGVLEDVYQIDHATLQVEPLSHRECSEVSW